MKIEVKLSNERLITPSGLAIVGEMLAKSNFVKRVNRITRAIQKRSEPLIKSGDILLTYLGVLTQGKTKFEAVSEMDDDPEAYKTSLGLSGDIPSAEITRQRMDTMASKLGDELREEILDANIDLLRSCGVEPTALPNGYVPIDIDVTPFDNSKTKKQGVSRTYKGFDGYAPIMAYIGTEGYLVNNELREGRQHCQKHTPQFLQKTLRLSHRLTKSPLLVRLDSGNDAAVNLGILIEDGSYFIIKRNLRNSESKEDWLNKVKAVCLPANIHKEREGKTVYIGSSWKDVEYTDFADNKKTVCLRMCYEVAERTIDKHGQTLLIPDVEVNLWWTNLGLSDNDVIELYHKHGESEQFHSEIKTDMDVQRLPSGKFATNKLILELTILAYNILRMMGQMSLKSDFSPKVKDGTGRRRLRTVINNLILIAGHITKHSRKMVLALGRSNVWRFTFVDLWQMVVRA